MYVKQNQTVFTRSLSIYCLSLFSITMLRYCFNFYLFTKSRRNASCRPCWPQSCARPCVSWPARGCAGGTLLWFDRMLASRSTHPDSLLPSWATTSWAESLTRTRVRHLSSSGARRRWPRSSCASSQTWGSTARLRWRPSFALVSAIFWSCSGSFAVLVFGLRSPCLEVTLLFLETNVQ